MRRAVLLLALLPLALDGCGRSGPPRPPGPREAITHPRAYPAPDPLPPMTLPPQSPETQMTPGDLLTPSPPLILPPGVPPTRFGFPRS